MIVLGNPRFATAMKLVGIKDSYKITSREDGLKLIKNIPRDEFIIANAKVVEMLPELRRLKNVVTIPDNPKNFGGIDDLKHLIKSAVGIEINL